MAIITLNDPSGSKQQFRVERQFGRRVAGSARPCGTTLRKTGARPMIVTRGIITFNVNE